jgi:hypothetical protein
MTLLAACHDRAPSDPIVLDGSSTAFPLAEAVAHEFMKVNYFTDSINGRAGVSRKDYTSSADDEVIVKGVADDELALG